MSAAYGAERDADRAALQASEYKMEQMAETLQSLNGIFKNMQTDGTVTRAADMTSKCLRLEKEAADLGVKVMMLGKVRAAALADHSLPSTPSSQPSLAARLTLSLT